MKQFKIIYEVTEVYSDNFLDNHFWLALSANSHHFDKYDDAVKFRDDYTKFALKKIFITQID